MWSEHNFTVVWTFFSIAFFRIEMRTDLYFVLIVFSAQNIAMSSVFNSIILEMLSHFFSKAKFEILLLLRLSIKLFWKECRSILRNSAYFWVWIYKYFSYLICLLILFYDFLFATYYLNIVTVNVFSLWHLDFHSSMEWFSVSAIYINTSSFSIYFNIEIMVKHIWY